MLPSEFAGTSTRQYRWNCTDAFGDASSQVYDRAGNVIQRSDGKGKIAAMSFDALNRQKTVTDRISGVTTFGYTPTSQLSALTDAQNQSTVYDYNDRGEKIKETYPDHVSGQNPGDPNCGFVTFEYDPAGRMFRKAKGKKGKKDRRNSRGNLFGVVPN